MSLINKVLKEIDKKHMVEKTGPTNNYAQPTKPPTNLALGTNFSNKYKGKFLNRYTVLIVLAVVFAFILSGNHHHSTTKSHKTELALPVKKQTIAAPIVTKIANKEAATKLDNIVLNSNSNKTIVNFVISKSTYYYVEHGQTQQLLKIVLGNTAYDAEFPLNLTHTAIKNLSMHKENSDTIIELELLPDTQVLGLQLYDQPQTQLQLTLLNTSVAIGTVEKKAIPLTVEQRSMQDYQDALDLLAQNKSELAIDKLYGAIKATQDNPKTYDLLATLLIKNNRFNDASRLLGIALNAFPNDSHLIQLKAHALIHQGQLEKAIQLLLNNPPPINQEPEYYALIASIYQQQDKSMLAAQLYNRLLQFQPTRATWWMGLGIALESAGKDHAAQEAYKKAADLGTLPAAAQEFVITKINQ